MCNTSNALYVVYYFTENKRVLSRRLWNVSSKRRITQIVNQWIPGSRASNSECPTTIPAEIVSWHNQMMAGGTKLSLIVGVITDAGESCRTVGYVTQFCRSA